MTTGLIFTVVKYIFSGAAACITVACTKNARYTVSSLLELSCIFLITDALLPAAPIPALILNDVLILIFNAQMLVLAFGGVYTTLVMLTNLDSLEDLFGKLVQYLIAIAVVLVFTFLPVQYTAAPKLLLPALVAADAVFVAFFGTRYSPACGLVSLLLSVLRNMRRTRLVGRMTAANASAPASENEDARRTGPLGRISAANASEPASENEDARRTGPHGRMSTANASEPASESEDIRRTYPANGMREKFYHEGIADHRKKPADLAEKPNIILIFTEGLSQHMISDPRNVMCNVRSYQEKSLNFAHYFNHTYATYCAVIGQLTSGFQLNNYDKSSLPSLQGILKGQGYHTTMINTEPKNRLFTKYLSEMGFDEVRGAEVTDLLGEAHSLSDRQAYELLYDCICRNKKRGEPFFAAIYTFGTHISFDSPDEKFGNGKDTTLNKMYNLDAQFGKFMEKFESGDLAANTLIVFTGDHCAYGDLFYRSAYPDYYRANVDCDEMPLFLYYRGIRPETVDACGRNTLCMAPTLLDYLDISAPNSFLGSSLFGPEGEYDTIFFDATYQLTTKNGQIRELTRAEKHRLEPVLMDYFAAKAQ